MTAISRRALLALSAAALPALALADSPAPAVLTAPIRLAGERVLVAVTLDGRGPYDFIVDTGAVVSGILDSLGRDLKLKVLRKVGLASGAGAADFPLYAAADVVIGGVFRQPEMAMFGMDRVTGGGVGILAAGLVTTLDSDLDFTLGELRLYPRGRGVRPTDYERLGSGLPIAGGANGSARMVVDAELDGVAGRFLLDTGAPGQVTLTPKGSARRGLWSNARPFAPVARSGITGLERGPAHLTRARSLRIGATTLDAPLVLVHDPSAFDPGDGTDGIIGIHVLQRFDLSVDVAGKAVWVRPNGRRPEPWSSYNHSGLWFDVGRDGRARVTQISPGSPAAEAGVQLGDALPSGVRVGDISRTFGGPVGAQVPLDIERGGKRMTLTLTLRDYL